MDDPATRARPRWVRLALRGVTDRRRAMAAVRIPLVAGTAAVLIPAGLVLATAGSPPEYRAPPSAVLGLLPLSGSGRRGRGRILARRPVGRPERAVGSRGWRLGS